MSYVQNGSYIDMASTNSKHSEGVSIGGKKRQILALLH